MFALTQNLNYTKNENFAKSVALENFTFKINF